MAMKAKVTYLAFDFFHTKCIAGNVMSGPITITLRLDARLTIFGGAPQALRKDVGGP